MRTVNTIELIATFTESFEICHLLLISIPLTRLLTRVQVYFRHNRLFDFPSILVLRFRGPFPRKDCLTRSCSHIWFGKIRLHLHLPAMSQVSANGFDWCKVHARPQIRNIVKSKGPLTPIWHWIFSRSEKASYVFTIFELVRSHTSAVRTQIIAFYVWR